MFAACKFIIYYFRSFYDAKPVPLTQNPGDATKACYKSRQKAEFETDNIKRLELVRSNTIRSEGGIYGSFSILYTVLALLDE